MNKSLLWKLTSTFCVLLLLVLCSSLQAQTAATSLRAGSVTNTTNPGSGISWINPTNVQMENGTFATAYISGANKATNFLDATNWGFQTINSTAANYIPANATINGIQVSIKRRKTLSGSVRDVKVILLKAGNETGTAKVVSTSWPTTNAAIAYGNEVDLWGATLTAADLINSGFGVRIGAKNKGRKAAQAEIDHIRITVFFNQTIYYSRPTGNLELLSSWATTAGTQPASFTRDGQVFILNRTASLTGNVSISGANSGFVVGDGAATTLTISSNFTLAARTSLRDNASLVISNASTPALSSIGTNTTITYNATEDQTIADANYFNLTLSGSGSKLFTPNVATTTTIANNLIIAAGVTANNQGNAIIVNGNSLTNSGTATGAGAYTLSVHDANATISGNGTFSNLELDATSSSNSASTITLSGPTVVREALYLNSGTFANGANLTMGAGSLLKMEEGTLANTLTSAGYDVTYLSSSNTTIVAGNELTGAVRNLTMQLASDATLSLNRSLTATGNVTVSSGILDASNSNYNLTIGGDLTNNGTLNLRNNTVTLNGSGLQTIQGANAVAFNSLTINKPAGSAQLGRAVTVANLLTLTNGLLSTSATNTLTLGANAAWVGGNSNSFINGPMNSTVNSLSANKTFPIGKNNVYRPVTLAVSQRTTAPTLYTAEVLAGIPPTRSFTTGIENVSTVRYYSLGSNNASNINTASVTLNYNSDDEVINPAILRIAKAEGTQWLNAGGSGSAATTGTITTGALTTLGDFVLANVKTIALPLTWVSFNASKKAAAIELSWQTAQEVNTKNFIIEKSSNGQSWARIGAINSNNTAGRNTYGFTDLAPASVNFYRVKQVDIDGQFTYSKTLRITFENSTNNLTVYPTVVKNESFTCIIKDPEFLKASQLMVSVYDCNGKLVYVNKVKPVTTLSLSCAGWSAGQYTILIGAENRHQQAKIIVQ